MHAPVSPLPEAKATVEVRVSGPELRRSVRKATATGKAVITEQLRDGTAVLHHLTEQQARMLAKANVSYVAALHRASPEQWTDIVLGRIKLQSFARQRRELTEAQVDKLVSRVGPDRVMAALDRATAPQATKVRVELLETFWLADAYFADAAAERDQTLTLINDALLTGDVQQGEAALLQVRRAMEN